jgi:hypothetical protein
MYRKCHRMSPNITECHRMSPNVIECHRMSPNVTEYHRMSPNITECHRMSPNITECHRMSPNITECHRIRLVEFTLFPPDKCRDGLKKMMKKYCYLHLICERLKIEPIYLYIIWSFTGLSWLRTELMCRLYESGIWMFFIVHYKQQKHNQYHNSTYI